MTEHDKLVEDMLHAYFLSPYPSGTRRAMRAALAVAVEQCAHAAYVHIREHGPNGVGAAIRALLSPNDRGEA